MSSSFSPQQVQHVAELANIPVSDSELIDLASAFTSTLKVIENLQELDTKKVEQMHQVTGLVNVWREDVIDHQQMFSQSEALANAKETHQGYIVVPPVLKHKS